MLYTAIALYAVFIIVYLPLRFTGRSFLSINKGYVLANISLYGLPPFSFKITVDKGLVLDTGKKKIQLIKEKFLEMAKSIKIDPAALKKLFSFRKLSVRGVFGGDNAASTAIGAAAGTLFFRFINNLFSESVSGKDIYICPDYNEARLELEINIVTVTSISMIIYTIFMILKNRRKQHDKRPQ
ncbi:MAG: hypothetical protein GX095_03780 [Clostridiales bacterium]|jgi:hypothetical protein|nr:hypothetical protein [Clostridiales bacterium]HOB64761.1 hypothetical protein [Clostridia bacterium]HOK81440.1 hypothetical protein [Clostridia bacterium]HOL60740.1 hypothetical protein [Clostridia bacterium]HPO53315.1 hypothetical protein [Clostridia bacterium]